MTNSAHVLATMVLMAVGSVFLSPITATAAAPVATRHVAAVRTVVTMRIHVPPTPTTVSSTTTTTFLAPVVIPAAPTTTVPAAPPAPATAPAPASTTTAPAPNGIGYGCTPALAYLQAHAAPGFVFECPGWADGRQAMTCYNIAGLCAGAKLIAIATPCPAAYMNEASNSWVVVGKSNTAIDPYGYCH